MIFTGQADTRKVEITLFDRSDFGLNGFGISRCETLVIGATFAERINIELGHDRYV